MSSQRDPQGVADAYLALEASKKVFASCLEAYDAMLINGKPSEMARYRDACMSACEAILDRKVALVRAQLINDGLDPTTRQLI